jgi:Holliday junction resolvasome RuvABC endonuclease subunit
MIKLSIKDIEKKLGKTVRKNTLALGVDVAEAFTGLALLRTDNDYIYIENTEVIETSAKDDHFHRAEHFLSAIEKFKQTIASYKEYKMLIIERCFFGQNPETLIHLAQFGILAYVGLKKAFDDYYYWGATTARSIIGFNQKKQEEKGTLKAEVYTRDTKDKNGKIKHKKGENKKIECKALVHDYLKTDFNVTFKTKDEADGFVLALAGLLK